MMERRGEGGRDDKVMVEKWRWRLDEVVKRTGNEKMIK